LADHGWRDGAALGGMLAFGFDGNGVAAEHVQLAFRKCLLIQLAAFSRGRDRIEDARVCDARFSVIGDELIAVGRYPDTRETRFLLHGPSRGINAPWVRYFRGFYLVIG